MPRKYQRREQKACEKSSTDYGVAQMDMCCACPFYSGVEYRTADGGRSLEGVARRAVGVVCESPEERSNLVMRFRSHADYVKHVKNYCCNRYICCEIYRMMMDLYEGDE